MVNNELGEWWKCGDDVDDGVVGECIPLEDAVDNGNDKFDDAMFFGDELQPRLRWVGDDEGVLH